MPQVLQLVGVKKRNIIVASIFEFITAPKVYLPTVSRCGNAHPLAAKRWNEILTAKVRSQLFTGLASDGDALNRTILVKRRPGTTRSAVNHDELMAVLNRNLPVEESMVEFTGDETMEQTAAMFFQAKVIVAPHGAGLSNMVFSRSDTKVIEVFFLGPPNYCYAVLAGQLGFEYHNVIGGRDGSQIVYDVDPTVSLVKRVLRHWKRDTYRAISSTG